MEVGREQHEAEVRLGGGHREDQQVGVRRGADFLDEFGQARLGLALLVITEQRPLRVIDMIEQMHDVPPFTGHERCDFWGGHGNGVSGGRWKYSFRRVS